MTNTRALSFGILCWAAYLCGRTYLQHHMPTHNWTEYIYQDLAISALRLCCGITCLWIARKRWYDSALGITFPAPLSPLAWYSMATAFVAFLIGAAAQQSNWQEALWIRAVEVAVALVVAFNEEVGYRLLIFSGLRELGGRAAAVLGTSVLFTLMHFGYQPNIHLPKVFLTGLCFALLRDRGASFKTLVLLHFLIDSIAAVALGGAMANWSIYWVSTAVTAVAVLLAWLAPTRHEADGESLLFVYGSLKPGSPEAAKLGVEKRCDVMTTGSAQGKLAERGGYPAMIPSKDRLDHLTGVLLRLRDRDYLSSLDAYEGDEYIRDKAVIQLENGSRCEAWIYVASSAQA